MQAPRIDLVDPFLKGELLSSLRDGLDDPQVRTEVTLRRYGNEPTIDHESGTVTRETVSDSLNALRRTVSEAEAIHSAGRLQVGDRVYLIERADVASGLYLLDQYAFANSITQTAILANDVDVTGRAHSFVLPAAATPTEIVLGISVNGSPTGDVDVGIYATSGGVPTGSPLLAVPTFDASELETDAEAEDLYEFASPTELAAGTYAFGVIFENGNIADPAYVDVRVDTTSPSHSGVGASRNVAGSWSASPSADTVFILRGTSDEGGSFTELVGSGMRHPADIVDGSDVLGVVSWEADPLDWLYQVVARRA